jgi:phytoene dehydrogenase-like protein
MNQKSENHWDAIVIGSGMGGMAVASILTRLQKKRVLVLERHWAPGGQTHEFSRKGKYSWDVGVHYVGSMGPGEESRRVMDYITGGAVSWNPLPEHFEHFSFPGCDFELPRTEAAMIAALSKRFPAEASGIRGFFKDMKRANDWTVLEVTRQVVPAPVAAVLGLVSKLHRRMAISPTSLALGRRIRDPLLKAILTATWGDYGLPPGRSAFSLHSLVVRSYLEGGWYPEGGASSIAKAVSAVLAGTGGRIEVSAEALEIIVEKGAAVGVRARLGKGGGGREETFFAPMVFSAAGAGVTYQKLLRPHVPEAWVDMLERFPKGMSAVTLFLGLKGDPRGLGFKGENRWIYDSLDHDVTAADGKALLEGRPGSCFLSFPSLKQKNPTHHTAELISHASVDDFARWAGSAWMKRGDEYLRAKERIADGLLDFVEKRHPGLKDLVEYRELSTPLSYESFLGRPRGEFYGIAGVTQRYLLPWLRMRTPVAGCYLAGSDVMSLGVMGALMGGVAAVAVSLGASGWPKVMKAIREEGA